jgi:hypothetical protein
MFSAIAVAAFPMSIWPHAMLYFRPSSLNASCVPGYTSFDRPRRMVGRKKMDFTPSQESV